MSTDLHGTRPPPVWRMRIELDAAAVARPAWPAGVSVRAQRGPGDAAAVHALLEHAYRHGGGFVEPFATWWPATVGDAEFDPELWLLAESACGELAGAALCWTSAFVKDLVVRESWRRVGLGEALLRQALATFAARGARAVELKVQSTNAQAVRLYERVGMRIVERLPAAGAHPSRANA